MSVILDALKKAEADSQRDGVPAIRGAQSTARLENARRRRLWFIALLGTLVCTGAAWFTFVGQPKRLLAGSAAMQQSEELQDSAVNNTPIAGNIDRSNSQLDGLAPAEIVKSEIDGVNRYSSEGATAASSSAFLPAPSPELMQINTGAAKRNSQDNFHTVPSLATPNTGAAQPVFVQTPVPQLDKFASTPVEVKRTSDPISSSSLPASTATNVVSNERIGAATGAPAPELVLQAAKQTVSAAESVPELYQLDYSTRQALPKLGLTVHVFNVNPLRSFVIINNKRFGEGEQIEGTVLVAKIRRDGVECEFNGQRFILPRQL